MYFFSLFAPLVRGPKVETGTIIPAPGTGCTGHGFGIMRIQLCSKVKIGYGQEHGSCHDIMLVTVLRSSTEVFIIALMTWGRNFFPDKGHAVCILMLRYTYSICVKILGSVFALLNISRSVTATSDFQYLWEYKRAAKTEPNFLTQIHFSRCTGLKIYEIYVYDYARG